MFRRLLLIIPTFLIFLSCSNDDNSVPTPPPTPEPNKPPLFKSQTFNIKDNSKENEKLATVIATDPENKPLSYKITNLHQSPLKINNKTGVLELEENQKLDFWITEKYVLNVQVSDGIDTVENEVIINVIDTSTPFITSWKAKDTNYDTYNTLVIPLAGRKRDIHYQIDWGDGTVTEEFEGFPRHSYESPGIYQVKIKGRFNSLNMSNEFTNVIERHRPNLISIEQWGNSTWDDLEHAFTGCINMTYNATDSPDLSNIKSLKGMFSGTTITDVDLNGWDVSKVENMEYLFSGSLFNGNIDQWDVSNVKDMNRMFTGSSFNGKVDQWDVSKVENMEFMFADTSDFNNDISNWNVGNVVIMRSMFEDAQKFNQSLNKWNVENVENMFEMFLRARVFNGNVSAWNVSNVKIMRGMFLGARMFNQDLGNWELNSTTDIRDMIFATGLSPKNLSNTLVGWSKLASLPRNIELNLRSSTRPTIRYCEWALPAIEILTNKWGWRILSALSPEGCL